MTKARLYLLSLGIFVLLGLVALVATELILQQLSVSEAAEARDLAVETPYLPVKLKADYQGRVWGLPFSTNRYGFRGESDFPVEPPVGETRILSLGDSIGFGLGIEAEQHYTQLFEAQLNEPGNGTYRVINAGGQGQSPSGYLVYLKHEGLQFRPRRVLVEIELCNDVTDEALLRWRPTSEAASSSGPDAVEGGRYRVAWDGNLLGTYSTGSHSYEKTYLYTVLVRRTLNLLFQLDPPEPFATQSWSGIYYNLGFDRYLLSRERLESGWQRMFDALEATHRLLEQNGIEFLLMIMPSRYLYQDLGSWTEHSAELVRRAAETAREREIPYLDMTPAIGRGGGASLYFDFAHLTAEGNAVVARELEGYWMGDSGTVSQ